MFKNTKAFSGFSVNDLQKAKEFYGQTLGLEVSETPEGLALKIAGGGQVFAQQRYPQIAQITQIKKKISELRPRNV